MNSEIADRYATGSSARRGVVAVGDLPTSSVSAVQLIPETMGSESLRALESCAPLAPSQPQCRTVAAQSPGDGRRMCELVWGELGKIVKSGFGETAPRTVMYQ